MNVADNATVADLGDEPEGFWKPVHAQVAAWLAKYGEQEADDNAD
jgi:hypothetical protein